MATRKVTRVIEEKIEINFDQIKKSVKCDSISLVRSELRPPLMGTEEPKPSDLLIEFAFEPQVYQSKAYCLLNVTENLVKTVKEKKHIKYEGYHLKFEILGAFSIHGDVDLTHVELYLQTEGLAAMWPYVQEYTSDQMKRASFNNEPLPDIDPEKFINNATDEVEHQTESVGDGYIKVQIHRDGTCRVWA